MCNTFMPAGVDYTLQAGDTWFYNPTVPLRNLTEMIYTYHNSVGRNTVMELAFSIEPTGRLDPKHAALYASMGSWIRECYGNPVAAASSFGVPGPPWTLELELGMAPVDRIVIREDQTRGQRILAYGVSIQFPNGTTSFFSNGTSVGNKRIDLYGAAGSVTGKLQLQVFSTALGLPPLIKSFAAFRPCATAADDLTMTLI